MSFWWSLIRLDLIDEFHPGLVPLCEQAVER